MSIPFVVLICLLVVINMLVLLARAIRLDCRRICAHALGAARKALSVGHAVDDAIEARVQEEMRVRRALRAKAVVSTAPAVSVFIWAPVLVQQVVGGGVTTREKDFYLAMSGFYLTTLLAMCPRLLNSRTQEAWYFVFALLLAAFLSPIGVPAEEIHGWATPMFFINTWLAFFNLRMRSILLACGLQLTMIAYSVLQCGSACHGNRFRQMAAEACSAYIVFVLLMQFVKRGYAAAVRHQVQRESDQSTLAAVQAVLNTICDVVVELDSDFRLTKHAPQLADFLLFDHSKSLQAMPITNCLSSDEEREAFELRMRERPAGSSMANAFHSQMRDTSGSNIRTEIFSVEKLGLDASLHYIVGMREFTDVPPVQRSDGDQPTFLHRRFKTRKGTPPTKGTPPVVDRLPLGEPAAGTECSSSDKGSSVDRPAGALPTTEKAKLCTFMLLLGGWRCHGEPACCSLHTNLAEAARLGNMLRQRPCFPAFLDDIKWQCRGCGIIDKDYRLKGVRTRCGLCEHFAASDLDVSL